MRNDTGLQYTWYFPLPVQYFIQGGVYKSIQPSDCDKQHRCLGFLHIDNSGGFKGNIFLKKINKLGDD